MTTEFLKEDGKVPLDRDRFMIFVIVRVRRGAYCFSKEVGMGSRSHCLFGCDRRSVDISSSDAGVKTDSGGGASVGVMW